MLALPRPGGAHSLGMSWEKGCPAAGGSKARLRGGDTSLGIFALGCPRLESSIHSGWRVVVVSTLNALTPQARLMEGQGGCTDAQASFPALVTVPSMGYAPAPAPTSLQPLLPQQPVFVVQEVSTGTSHGGQGMSWADLNNRGVLSSLA